MWPEPLSYAPADLSIGMSAEFEREITEADIAGFAENSGDANPLHVDAEYAATTNFGRRIAHGAFQVGLASAMVGMFLPGRSVLLASAGAQFMHPLYYPARVKVRGEITSWRAPSRQGNLKVTVMTLPAGQITSEIHLGFTFHEVAGAAPTASAAPEQAPAAADGQDQRPVVLITGASGGLGLELIRNLLPDYRVVALINRTPLPEDLALMPGVRSVGVDFFAPDWESSLEAALGDLPLYGVVHAAWPGMPHGGLLKVPTETLLQQVQFGVAHTVALARILMRRVGEPGGRLVALSSIVGSYRPVLNLAAYSLGKATLEHTVRLLAPELALKRVTSNAICPTFIAAGMNNQSTSRQRMLEQAAIPLGRLCETGDVVNTVRYLLSPAASFLSGETIALAGGQLLH